MNDQFRYHPCYWRKWLWLLLAILSGRREDVQGSQLAEVKAKCAGPLE